MSEDLKQKTALAPSASDIASIFDQDFFRAFGDPTRSLIFGTLLRSNDPLSVTAIMTITRKEQSDVSHALAILRGAKLVDFKKDGKYRLYFANRTYFLDRMKACMEYGTNKESGNSEKDTDQPKPVTSNPEPR